MILENNIDINELKKGLEELQRYIKVSANRTILIELFKKYLSTKSGYYILRDEILPEIMGQGASKALIWSIVSGFIYEDGRVIRSCLDANNVEFIHSLVLLFTENIILAKKYNENPMGYYSLHIAYSKNNKKNNLFIKRNDESEYVLCIDIDDCLRMAKDLLYYYNKIQEVNNYKIKEDSLKTIDEVMSIIECIKNSGCEYNE